MTLRIRAAGLLCALLLTATLPLVSCDKTQNTPPEDSTEEVATETETEPMTEEITTEEITTEEVTTEEVVVERVPDGTIPFVPDHPETISADWKAIWLSQFDLQPIYTDGNKQRAEADFRSRMEQVLDNVVSDGFNTVVLQLRPYADSMYPSDVYPPSKYSMGSYAGEFTYDPIAIITLKVSDS